MARLSPNPGDRIHLEAKWLVSAAGEGANGPCYTQAVRPCPLMMNEQDELARISARYAAYAVEEARGWSGIYERLALAIAGSRELLAFLASLPADKRQPNLFLAAVRHVC